MVEPANTTAIDPIHFAGLIDGGLARKDMAIVSRRDRDQ